MLAALGWRRGAAAWVLAVGATLGTMLVLKLAFLACGTVLPSIGVHTPSGHTAAAALAAGGLAALLSRGNNRGGHVLAWALGAAIVVGFTRVALAMHSVPEVPRRRAGRCSRSAAAGSPCGPCPGTVARRGARCRRARRFDPVSRVTSQGGSPDRSHRVTPPPLAPRGVPLVSTCVLHLLVPLGCRTREGL